MTDKPTKEKAMQGDFMQSMTEQIKEHYIQGYKIGYAKAGRKRLFKPRPKRKRIPPFYISEYDTEFQRLCKIVFNACFNAGMQEGASDRKRKLPCVPLKWADGTQSERGV